MTKYSKVVIMWHKDISSEVNPNFVFCCYKEIYGGCIIFMKGNFSPFFHITASETWIQDLSVSFQIPNF